MAYDTNKDLHDMAERLKILHPNVLEYETDIVAKPHVLTIDGVRDLATARAYATSVVESLNRMLDAVNRHRGVL